MNGNSQRYSTRLYSWDRLQVVPISLHAKKTVRGNFKKYVPKVAFLSPITEILAPNSLDKDIKSLKI